MNWTIYSSCGQRKRRTDRMSRMPPKTEAVIAIYDDICPVRFNLAYANGSVPIETICYKPLPNKNYTSGDMIDGCWMVVSHINKGDKYVKIHHNSSAYQC